MARYVGRNAAVYVALTSTGNAQPLSFCSAFTLDSQTDQIDVTAFGDANKVSLAGLPSAQGTVEGFKDKGKKQLLAVARGGFAAKSYFYEDTVNEPTAYHFCEANWSSAVSLGVGAAAGWSGSWTAATDLLDGPGIS